MSIIQLPSAVTAERQVEFISYLQRLLVEGDFVATYKFALLHALADICIEQVDVDISNAGAQCKIPIDTISEKFIELYWQHSLPFSATESTPYLLKQNTGTQAAIISQLADCRAQGINSMHQLKRSSAWRSLLAKTGRTVKEGPLWRLQILAGKDDCFLYFHDKNKGHIVLNSDVGNCFRRFYDLVVSLARSHWLQKIRAIPSNQSAMGDQGDLSEFLFGSKRNALSKAQPVLVDLQQGLCFYCQKALKQKGEVDHFIPWARYPSDLGHNFVLAHSKCNNSKRDHLAAHIHRDRWMEQNIITHHKTINNELGQYFACETERSQAVTQWAYTQASGNGSSLWLDVNGFTTS